MGPGGGEEEVLLEERVAGHAEALASGVSSAIATLCQPRWWWAPLLSLANYWHARWRIGGHTGERVSPMKVPDVSKGEGLEVSGRGGAQHGEPGEGEWAGSRGGHSASRLFTFSPFPPFSVVRPTTWCLCVYVCVSVSRPFVRRAVSCRALVGRSCAVRHTPAVSTSSLLRHLSTIRSSVPT